MLPTPIPNSHTHTLTPRIGAPLQGQLNSMMRMMYNTKRVSPELSNIIKNADKDGDGKFSLGTQERECLEVPAVHCSLYGALFACTGLATDEWHTLSSEYPQLMKPPLDMQQIMRKKVFGTR